MKNSKSKKKAIVLSLGLAATLLSAPNVSAQNNSIRGLWSKCDLFNYGNRGRLEMEPAVNTLNEDDRGLFNKDNIIYSGRGYNEMNLTVNTQDFGQDVPLGSGIAILVGAGLGYAVLKRKEDKQ